MGQKTITVKAGQTIYDIAIQEYGGVEGVRSLIADNVGTINRSSVLTVGQLVKVKSDPVDKDTLLFYKRKRLNPVSSMLSDGKLGGDFNNDFNNDFN